MKRTWNVLDLERKVFERDFWREAFEKNRNNRYIREEWKNAESALQEQIIRLESEENPVPGYLRRLRKISRRGRRLLICDNICNYIVTGNYTTK